MKTVLFNRFEFSTKPRVYLNKKRKRIRDLVQHNLNQKIYDNEIINCHICNSSYEEHELISKKERHGLEMDCVICKNCGLVFTNPRMSQESFNDFYTNYYRDLYNYEIGERSLKNLFQDNYNNGKKVYEFVKKFISPKSRILELGCANGGLLKYFKEMGHEVTGLDLGEAEVEDGINNYGLNLEHKSIEEYESNEKKDLIIMIHVIEHLTDCKNTLEKIRENLNDEGYLYISCPDIDVLSNGEIYKSDWLTLMQNAHTINFDKISINNLLNKYGFEVHYYEPGMNLIAKKSNIKKSHFENNYSSALNAIKLAEKTYQSRNKQNSIRIFLETNGFFAFLIFVTKPLNYLLIRLGVQKYIKIILKRIYKLI